MELQLKRTYFPDGTNGILLCEGKTICLTIELPWKNNEKRVSCIPEGEYFLKKRFSAKFKWHLEVIDVQNRSLILFHPANNALKELNGCIAPVTKFSGPGLGLQSRVAFTKLKNLVYKSLEKNESVKLIVKSDFKKEIPKNKNMNVVKRAKAPTPKFFKVLRNVGLALAAVGGTILAAPIALPVAITTLGGYLVVAGSVASAVSQVTTPNEK